MMHYIQLRVTLVQEPLIARCLANHFTNYFSFVVLYWVLMSEACFPLYG